MKTQTLLLTSVLFLAPAVSADAQRSRSETRSAGDTTVLTAEDSLRAMRRQTAAPSPFHACSGDAFQSCASGETVARLSLDGTAFGVLMTRRHDGKTIFLPRNVLRAPGGGGGGGGGAAGGEAGGGRGGKRRG